MARQRSRSRSRSRRAKSSSKSLFSARSKSRSKSRKKTKTPRIHIYSCKRPLPSGNFFKVKIFPGISTLPLSLLSDLAKMTKNTCNKNTSFPSGQHAVESLKQMQLHADSTHHIIISYINDKISLKQLKYDIYFIYYFRVYNFDSYGFSIMILPYFDKNCFII